jgi:hypothetical protein
MAKGPGFLVAYICCLWLRRAILDILDGKHRNLGYLRWQAKLGRRSNRFYFVFAKTRDRSNLLATLSSVLGLCTTSQTYRGIFIKVKTIDIVMHLERRTSFISYVISTVLLKLFRGSSRFLRFNM